MTTTYIDANVLIAAARATDELAERALSYLDDPQRSFVSSAFVRLEVLPKPIYLQRRDEAAFYTTFFSAVTAWGPITTKLIEHADQLASTYGLSALDAIHVASALALQAEELITAERHEKPIHRVRDLRVISIASRRA
ncbi:MAG: type II toxin-antitoxin system VapC family toxin [Candidatus Viridilinea halotolerans]|uniref:Type II toxin-antitoxin system VapC family toxin n=1 Tax=Candidatus Viridilinea halotolerans TaxID=2491704 RepID=A0A426U315_9CHLR|nr:MAG: type II toxin-antitoxin system VapC family toxin [Candidatus Viridilinea halotolerans]